METILFIDEMLDIMKPIQANFKEWGFDKKYSIVTTESSLEALHIMRDQKIDLVIQNFSRPKTLDGLRTLKLMKSDNKLKNIPSILYTAFTERSYFEDKHQDLLVYFDQFDSVVTKLIGIKDFKDLIPKLVN